MPPLLLRTAEVAAQPWTNGGGLTRELLALPGGDDWRIRISVAEVGHDGPFSTFAGVDRWLAVLDGAGVELTIDGSAHRATARDDALAFSGAAETRCRLIDGPTRDLNLMLRGVAGAMARVVPGATWRPEARACGLYATFAGECRASGQDDAPTSIPAHALCWWHDAPAALAFDSDGWWLRADTTGITARTAR